jgi:WD40 repeat protein/tetratricopeptide (TPR) repeat protein
MSPLVCTGCGAPLDAPDAALGRLIQCPRCKAVALVLAAPLPAGSDSERSTLPPAPSEFHSEAALPPSPATEALPPYVDPACPSCSAAPPGYTILQELGRGGMGVVYLAHHGALRRDVALKMILSGVHAGDEEMRRFRREAEAIARLRHPGIVQVYEIGSHDGRAFLSLEFCAGGSLEKKLLGSPLPPGDAAALVARLADAVRAAHEARVVHRDLKPANVLLGVGQAGGLSLPEAGQAAGLSYVPKITDFGLAKQLDEQGHTATGAVMGTPSYMAPEQARGESDIGPACDIYALGAILYECLTGRPPFRAATAYETILQVIGEEPASPRQLNPEVPRDLETVCLKCLRKGPEHRYESARGLADDLERFLAGKPVLARPVGAAERAWKWARRNPAVAGLISAVALTLLVGAALAWGLAAWALGEKGRADEQAGAAQANEEEARHEKERADLERDVAELRLYAGRLGHAQDAWKDNNVARALDLLQECPLYLRGLEHRLLWNLYTRQGQRPLEGHRGDVNSVAISGDGRRIVSGSADKTVKVWDAERGKELLTLKGHAGEVLGVAISGDGRRVVSCCSGDETVKVWDAERGRQRFALKGHTAAVLAVAISDDGRRIVSGGGNPQDNTRPGEVKVWDAQTGKELLTLKGHPGMVGSVAISPDGRRIVSGGGQGAGLLKGTHQSGIVKVWDAHSGRELFTLRGHAGRVNSVAISGDGRRIVSSDRAFVGSGEVKVWDAERGRELLTLKEHLNGAGSVAISGDGRRIVSCGFGDRTLKVWDAERGSQLFALKGHTSAVLAAAISGDGRRIVSGGGILFDDDDRRGELKVWDAQRGQELPTLEGHPFGIDTLATSGDGRRIVSVGPADLGQRRELKVRDVEQGQELLAVGLPSNQGLTAAISADGRLVAAGGGEVGKSGSVKVWDVARGRERFTLEGHTDQVICLALSSDGRLVASGSRDGTLKVWDAVRGRERFTLKAHADGVACVDVSLDGRRIVSGSADQGDGDRPGEVKVWDAERGQELFTLKGHAGAIGDVAISADGKRIVSNTRRDPQPQKLGEIKVWDAQRGKELLTLKGHAEAPTGVTITPDGRRILGAAGGTLKVWDAERGQELLSLKGLTNRLSGVDTSSRPAWWPSISSRGLTNRLSDVDVSPDGRRIIGITWGTLTEPGQVQVWDAPGGREFLLLKGHAQQVAGVAISADGKQILGRDVQGKVLGWDLATSRLLPRPPDSLPANAGRTAVSRDGRLRAAAEGFTVRVEFLSDAVEAAKLRASDLAWFARLARFDPTWHRSQALAAEDDGDSVAVSFHLEPLLRRQPYDASLHAWQAGALARLGKREQAALRLTQALLLNPHVSLWPLDPDASRKAEEAANAGDWKRAARLFERAAHQPGASGETMSALLASTAAGQESDRRRLAAELVRQVSKETNGQRRVAPHLIAVDVPCGAEQARQLLAGTLSDLTWRRDATTMYCHGAALYRAGRYAEAGKMLAGAIRAAGKDGLADASLYQALIAGRLGRRDEARKLVRRAEARPQPVTNWRQRVRWEALLKEARAVIEAPPAMPRAPR